MKKVLNEEQSPDVFQTDTVLVDINEQFTLDSLNQWTTTIGLIQSSVTLIEKTFPSYEAHIFYHESEFHEYREIDREGLTSIPDDSIFIGCLSMVDSVILLEKFFSDFQIDDPITMQFFREIYGGKYIVPVVHCFELLAFILVCTKSDSNENTKIYEKELDANSVDFFSQLTNRLQINLYAASVADKRQRELLKMTQYPTMLQHHRTLDEVYSNLLTGLAKQIQFDKGVCYAYEEETNTLVPFDRHGIKGKIATLKNGAGISGQVFEWQKPIFIPDRMSHPAYSLMAEEKFIDGAFISVPLGNDKMKLGVVTLVCSPGSKNSFGVEHRYMLEIAASFITNEITNRHLFAELDESNFNVVKSLALALEAKDTYTEGHSARVTKYSVEIAKRLGYSQERIHQLRYGAMLHDIGKIGISDAIINKKTRLTDEEYNEMKAHTEIGYKIVNNNPFFNDVKDYIRYHHETLTGTGYYHKKKDDYPEEAMVISCADIFDALTSNRPYRKALPFEEALKELKTSVDVHFTKEIYDAFADYVHSKDFSTEATPEIEYKR